MPVEPGKGLVEQHYSVGFEHSHVSSRLRTLAEVPCRLNMQRVVLASDAQMLLSKVGLSVLTFRPLSQPVTCR